MIEIVALLVVALPLALWLAAQWWPNRRRGDKVQTSKPRHRWWQP